MIFAIVMFFGALYLFGLFIQGFCVYLKIKKDNAKWQQFRKEYEK